MNQLRKAYAEIAAKVIKPIPSIFLPMLLVACIEMNES